MITFRDYITELLLGDLSYHHYLQLNDSNRMRKAVGTEAILSEGNIIIEYTLKLIGLGIAKSFILDLDNQVITFQVVSYQRLDDLHRLLSYTLETLPIAKHPLC